MNVSPLSFAKGQALGNDYLVVERDALPVPIDAAWIRALCDRHRGAGSDGVLVGEPDAEPIRLRIYNPDGSEAEKSGNGLRIFGAYLHGIGRVGPGEPFEVELARDRVTMRVEAELAGGAVDVRVEMGRASFRAADVGFRPSSSAPASGGSVDESAEFGPTDLPLADGETARVQPVSLANPHCVVFVEALDRDDFLRRAPQLATHTAFPNGTNVQFARVAGPAEVEAWIWERGVGETLASGSSSCAVAAAALRQGRVSGRNVTVRMRGGTLDVAVGSDGAIRIQGPAQIVYEAKVPAKVFAAWVAGSGADG